MVEDALAELWPADAVGKILAWSLALRDGGSLARHVDRFGAPLGSGGLSVLGKTLGDRLATPVVVDERALTARLWNERFQRDRAFAT